MGSKFQLAALLAVVSLSLSCSQLPEAVDAGATGVPGDGGSFETSDGGDGGAPWQDGGAVSNDAGSADGGAETDAGSTTDGGTTGTDAGSGADGGTSGTDAGAGGDGGTVTMYSVGGSISGLTGSGLTLLLNGAGPAVHPFSNGPFSFPTQLADGSTYAVTVSQQPLSPSQTCTVSSGNGLVAGSNVTNVAVVCTTNSFFVGGQVSGLVGQGLVLQNNGGGDLSITANGSFAFPTPLASGSSYAVTVTSQPSNPWQTCNVSQGTGTIGAGPVNDVAIVCTTTALSLGGTLTGLVASTTVTLTDGLAHDVVLSSNGSFTFPAVLPSGSSYSVSVKTLPTNPWQSCSVTNASGTLTNTNVSNVSVTCTRLGFTIGGTVSGLSGSGLILQQNGGNDLAIGANGAFQFSSPVLSGDGFAVTVASQPTNPWQTCQVSAGSGIVGGANVAGVLVNCASNTYTLGGTVSGLNGNSVTLSSGTGFDVTVSSNGAFAFAQALVSGTAYSVSVQAEPTNPWQTCSVGSGSGAIGSQNVTNVQIACTNRSFAVRGTVSGLAGSGLVLSNNGGDDLPVSANGVFSFVTQVESGSPYLVAVKTQPTGPSQTCVVTSGSGVMAGADVTSVSIGCTTNSFTVAGTVVGLSGTGLVLRNNGADELSIASAGTFQFSTPLLSGQSYVVTVSQQPLSPPQLCSVSSASGTVGSAPVTSVVVNCTSAYTLGGTVAGLAPGTSVVLSEGTHQLTVTSNGSFTFPNLYVDWTSYFVDVATQPTSPSQTCSVSNASGWVIGASVSDVAVTCTTNSYTVSVNMNGARGSYTVQNNAETMVLAGAGTYAFPTPILSGATYSVTVPAPPTWPAQTCTPVAGNGTITNGPVSVDVNCVTNQYNVGGQVTGLAPGASVVLQGATGNTVQVNGAVGGSPVPFTFPAKFNSATTYSVFVVTHPSVPSQWCSITNETGWVFSSDVTSVSVSCQTLSYYIRPQVGGLPLFLQLHLQLNGSEDLWVNMDGLYAFATKISSGSSYTVAVATQPAGASCTIPNPTGTVGSGDVYVPVNCALSQPVGGTVSGLSGSGLVLRNNGTDDLPISANGTYAFATPLPPGSTYSVAVATQPTAPWQTCSVTNASGTVPTAPVTDADVACVHNTYSVGGTISNLQGTLVLQNNAGDDLTLNAGTTTFTFPTGVQSGNTYSVTVLANPVSPAQYCVVTGASGTVFGTSVSSVAVTCTNAYTVGGTVSNLIGTGLVLQLNGSPTNQVSGGTGSFVFPQPLADGSPYTVTVLTNPGPVFAQTCNVSQGSGTLSGGDVTNVLVTCGPINGIQVTGGGGSFGDGTGGCLSQSSTVSFSSNINVSTNYFTVGKVKVTLNGFSHPHAGDIDLYLVHSGGGVGSVKFLARMGYNAGTAPCGSAANYGGTYTFSDTAGSTTWIHQYSPTVPSGEYRPSGANGVLVGLSPAFTTNTTNGIWTLQIVDGVTLSSPGTLTGWTLTLMQ